MQMYKEQQRKENRVTITLIFICFTKKIVVNLQRGLFTNKLQSLRLYRKHFRLNT